MFVVDHSKRFIVATCDKCGTFGPKLEFGLGVTEFDKGVLRAQAVGASGPFVEVLEGRTARLYCKPSVDRPAGCEK